MQDIFGGFHALRLTTARHEALVLMGLEQQLIDFNVEGCSWIVRRAKLSAIRIDNPQTNSIHPWRTRN